MKIKPIMAALRFYRRTRVANTDAPGDASGGSPLGRYDKSAAQSISVGKMVELMRQKGLLTYIGAPVE